MRFHSLDQWLTWQESLHYQAIDLGLERCSEVAARMDLLSPEYKVISIAGTNGKGSSAAMLDSVYRNAGYKVGTYTSPHLVRYNERIKIDGVNATDQMLCEAFEQVDRARGDLSLTYFEFGTLAAMVLFQNSGLDLAVLEVGLGGRLDAVNILDADAALICSIALDHEQWLGDDREKIGYEKAGIMRPGKPAVCSDIYLPDSVIKYAGEVGARLFRVNSDFHVEVQDNSWNWITDSKTIRNIPKTDLISHERILNAAGVLMVVDSLSDKFAVNPDTVISSFRLLSLPGRYHRYEANKVPVIMDVAHNPQAAEVLAKTLAGQSVEGETLGVIGMLSDKDHGSVIGALAGVIDRWYVVSLESDRGSSAEVLIEVMEKIDNADIAGKFSSTEDAMETVCSQAQNGDRVVVTGSFLTVGAAMKWLDL